MSDAALLDEIKFAFGLKNDAALAKFLDVTRASVCNVRFDGDRQLGIKARFLVLDRIAFLKKSSVSGQWIDAISTPKLIESLFAKSNGIFQRKEVIPATDSAVLSDKHLIEAVKLCLGFEDDVVLAKAIGLARNSISAVRHGRTTIGIEPRLAILNRIEIFPLDQLINVLQSADKLIVKIRSWSTYNSHTIHA